MSRRRIVAIVAIGGVPPSSAAPGYVVSPIPTIATLPRRLRSTIACFLRYSAATNLSIVTPLPTPIRSLNGVVSISSSSISRFSTFCFHS